ncbi:polysaccharide lyase [Pseudonocardia sp. H11422]|uniref:polysaccharide lyase n=1 Tax=Pseudonocardia sp. H11422 TaxID=2835866 RepID=UPI001BDC6B1B|nr:polysaccharide lyase [Pseudonocardia sp. H11422]
MIRHVMASAALVAVTLVTTDLYFGYAATDEHELVTAANTTSPVPPVGQDDQGAEPAPPVNLPKLHSSQRPPSDPFTALLTPPIGGPPGVIPPIVGTPQRPSPLPAAVREVFVGDFGTGDFSQWGTCQSVLMNAPCSGYDLRHHSMQLVDGPRKGVKAAHFQVRDGDIPEFGGGERSEVSAWNDEALTHEGDERWYEFSMRFPEDFRNPQGGWFIVMQWHSGSGSPPLAINISNEGTVDIGGDGVDHDKKTIGKVRPGEWVDYVLHAKFSNSASEGFVEAWENGVQTVERYNRATMSSDENYLKMGIYRDDEDSGTAEVSIAGVRIAAP